MPLRADGFEPSAYAIPPLGLIARRKLCHSRAEAGAPSLRQAGMAKSVPECGS